MKKIIFGFSVGILAGFYLSSKYKIDSNPETHEVEVRPAEPSTQSMDEPKEKMVQPKPQKAVVSNSEIVGEKRPTANKKLVVLNISEERVEAMERNFPELQKDISLFKDQQGWTVRFHRNSNLFSSLGIQDNDLIRFELFQQLKKDPSKENIVSRLEVIFANLER